MSPKMAFGSPVTERCREASMVAASLSKVWPSFNTAQDLCRQKTGGLSNRWKTTAPHQPDVFGCDHLCCTCSTRSSSREVRIRVVVDFSRGTLPRKRNGEKGHQLLGDLVHAQAVKGPEGCQKAGLNSNRQAL